MLCEGAERQNVRLAVQLFSHTVSKALELYKPPVITRVQVICHNSLLPLMTGLTSSICVCQKNPFNPNNVAMDFLKRTKTIVWIKCFKQSKQNAYNFFLISLIISYGININNNLPFSSIMGQF